MRGWVLVVAHEDQLAMVPPPPAPVPNWWRRGLKTSLALFLKTWVNSL